MVYYFHFKEQSHALLHIKLGLLEGSQFIWVISLSEKMSRSALLFVQKQKMDFAMLKIIFDKMCLKIIMDI